MNTLELARMEDAAVCYGIIEDGRAFQQEQGFVQWTKDYPDLDVIRKDMTLLWGSGTRQSLTRSSTGWRLPGGSREQAFPGRPLH